MALKHGLFEEGEIAYIDSSDENKGEVYHAITSESLIPDGVRLVLMTSLMDEGVNINNTNISGVHFIQDKIAGDLRDEHAIQFVSRFRKWFGDCNLYVKGRRSCPFELLASANVSRTTNQGGEPRT